MTTSTLSEATLLEQLLSAPGQMSWPGHSFDGELFVLARLPDVRHRWAGISEFRCFRDYSRVASGLQWRDRRDGAGSLVAL